MRRALEALVARSAVAAIARVTRPGGALILAYHNVVPDAAPPAGERTLHLRLSDFVAQIDALAASHEIVDLSTLAHAAPGGRRPVAAVTFDDAYRGCLELALPELVRRGLPATVFVAPGLLGAAGCWWDLLADPAIGTIPVERRQRWLEELRGDTAAVLSDAAAAGIGMHALPAGHGIATEAELLRAAALPGIRLGAHSWTHRNLAFLEPPELDAELSPVLTWLRARTPGVLPWLAFPYGGHTETVVRRALDAGYAGVLRISGGWVRPEARAARTLPRLNIPAGITADRFIIKSRGLWPI